MQRLFLTREPRNPRRSSSCAYCTAWSSGHTTLDGSTPDWGLSPPSIHSPSKLSIQPALHPANHLLISQSISSIQPSNHPLICLSIHPSIHPQSRSPSIRPPNQPFTDLTHPSYPSTNATPLISFHASISNPCNQLIIKWSVYSFYRFLCSSHLPTHLTMHWSSIHPPNYPLIPIKSSIHASNQPSTSLFIPQPSG